AGCGCGSAGVSWSAPGGVGQVMDRREAAALRAAGTASEARPRRRRRVTVRGAAACGGGVGRLASLAGGGGGLRPRVAPDGAGWALRARGPPARFARRRGRLRAGSGPFGAGGCTPVRAAGFVR